MAPTDDQSIKTAIAALIEKFQSGQLDTALDVGQTLAREHPQNAVIPNIVGAILTRQGNLNAAIDSFKAAIRIEPDYAQAYNNLGGAYQAMNRPTDALASYRASLDIDPTSADTNFNVGLLQQDLSRLDDAADAFRRATQIKPDMPEAHRNLGKILAVQNKDDAALLAFSASLKYDASNAETLNTVGSLYMKTGKTDDARPYFDSAIALAPDYGEPVYNLGVLARLNRDFETAMSYFQAALKLDADHIPTIANLAALKGQFGHLDEAIAGYQQIVTLEPTNAVAHHDLAMLKEFRAGDAQLEQLNILAGDASLSPTAQEYVQFARAKALDDIGDTEQAFRSLARANRLHKTAYPYDRISEAARFTAIRHAYNALGSARDTQDLTQRPIFIVGMPRSGTSLIEQMLAAHSQVFGAGELDAATDALSPRMAPVASLSWQSPKYDLTHAEMPALRAHYLSALRSLSPNAPYVTDKMPLNFRFVGFLAHAIGQARFIHIHRDPVATCWSNFQRRFSGLELKYAYDLGDIAHYYAQYQSIMDFWHQQLPGKILDVSYEDLTQSPRENIERVLDHCGLDWQDACLDFHKSKRAVLTASSQQVRKPIYQGSSQAWRRYEKHLQTLMDELGRD